MVVGGAGKVVVRALQRVTPPRCVTEHACLRHLCWSHWKVGVLASIPTAGRVGKDRKWCYRLNCIAPKACVLMWKFSFCRCHQVWGHSQLEWVLNPICLISLWKEERETRRQTVREPAMWWQRQRWHWCSCKPGDTKDCRPPPETERRGRILPRVPEEHGLADTLISDF